MRRIELFRRNSIKFIDELGFDSIKFIDEFRFDSIKFIEEFHRID